MQIITRDNKIEVKAHGNYEFPVSISIEEIQAYENGIFMWHWHPEIELTWIMEGEMEYRINNSTYYLKAGEGLFGNSNAMHAGFQMGNKECRYLSITFHPRFIYGYESSGLQTKYVDFIIGNADWGSVYLDPNEVWQNEVIELMKNIYLLYLKKDIDFEIQVHIELMKIWMRLYRYFYQLPESNNRKARHVQRLQEMLEYLQTYYTQDLRLDELAGAVNICKSECCRFFKKHMHMTIHEYQMMLRIQRSLNLLDEGSSVIEAATQVGFSNSAYYGQIFKRYVNCTPSEYKKRNKYNEEGLENR